MSGAGRRIATSAALIMLGNVVSRVLGLVREQTIAALFGASAAASVFTAASRVPTMVYDLLIGGAMTAALVPVFSEYAARDERRRAAAQATQTSQAAQTSQAGDAPELGRLAGAVAGVALAALIPAVGLLVVFARPLMSLLGVGFEPEVQEQGIVLVRVVLPSVVFLGVAAVLMGVLYSLQRVTLPSFSAGIYNLGIVCCALALARWFGVISLVIGVLVGAAGQVALQLPGLRGIRLRLSLDLSHPGLRRILRLYAPVAVGLAVSAAVVTLDTRLASSTGEGSLAAMRFATTLVQFPLGLVAQALSFATLPVLSRYGSSGATETGFKRTLTMGLKASLLLIVPATVALMALRQPVVRLLYERGAFEARDTTLTSLALLYYAPQLPFVAVDQLLIAAFYALQNTRLPVLVGVIGAGAYVVVALGTVSRLGMPGLVLANTVQNSSHAVILLLCLWRATGSLRSFGVGGAVARIGLAGSIMAVVLVVIQMLAPAPLATVRLAVYLALAGGTAGAAYIATLALLHGEEMVYARSIVAARLARRGGPRLPNTPA